MYSIRFHGRGGQGMKTAAHFLGNAFFLAGFEVQDAPRYGAERRGAPMTAYVRADSKPIFERGIVRHPGLVVVADDSLMAIAAAGVLQGLVKEAVLLIVSLESADTWQQRLAIQNPVMQLWPLSNERPLVSAACAGAAAALCGVIDFDLLGNAIEQELVGSDDALIRQNLEVARDAYKAIETGDRGMVKNTLISAYADYVKPEWIDLPVETAEMSAPVIYGEQTSVLVKTGLWRTLRPVIDEQRCNQCWWICSSSCPDSVINIEQGKRPVIDYEHCKGCMICVVQCPAHAIDSIPEAQAQQEENQ